MLTNTFNDYNTDMTKFDLLKCYIMKEQQSKATNITQYLTHYGCPVLKIHVASQHIHMVYEAINAFAESKHWHHFSYRSIASSFSPRCKSYLVTADNPTITNHAAILIYLHTPATQQLAHYITALNRPSTNSKGSRWPVHDNQIDKHSLCNFGWPS